MLNPIKFLSTRKGPPPASKEEMGSRAIGMTIDRRFGQFESKEQPANDRDFLRAYNNHPWLHAGTKAIARNAAKVPFKLYPENGEKEEITEGDAYDLMQRPNKHTTAYDWKFETSSFLTLAGDAFWELSDGTKDNTKILAGSKPVRFFVLEPSNMSPVPSAHDLYAGWNYTINAKTIPFRASEIVHFRKFNPLSMHYGTSDVSPLNNTLIIDFYAQRYERDFFENGGNIGSVISTPLGLDPRTFERLKQQLREQYTGSGKHHKDLILEGGMEHEARGADPDDASLTELREFGLREILAVLGVPRMLVQDQKDTSLANALAQLKIFWQETMIPLLILMTNKINNNLLIPFFDVRGEFDLKVVEALREDLKLKAEIANALIQNGLWTINETRKDIFDRDEVDWGKVGRDVLTRVNIGEGRPMTDNEEKALKILSNMNNDQVGQLLALREDVLKGKGGNGRK